MKYIITIVVSMIVGIAITFAYSELSEDSYDSNVTINSIKKIAELAAVEYNMSVVVKVTKKKKKFLEWKSAKFLVLVAGKVKGSVDLSKAKIDINKESRMVNIVFPKGAVKISNPEIAENGLEIITISNPNLFNKLKDSDFTKGQRKAIKKLRNTALDNGIKIKTKNEATIVMKNFLTALGYTATIIFK